MKLESQIFAYLKHSFCSKKVNVMGKERIGPFSRNLKYIEMLNYSASHLLGMTHQFENVIIPSFMAY